MGWKADHHTIGPELGEGANRNRKAIAPGFGIAFGHIVQVGDRLPDYRAMNDAVRRVQCIGLSVSNESLVCSNPVRSNCALSVVERHPRLAYGLVQPVL